MDIPYIITFLYLCSSVLFISNLWIQKETLSKIGFYLGVLGFIFHTFYLIKIAIAGSILTGGLAGSLIIFAWFIPFVFLISKMIYRLPFLGAFIFSLAFIGMVPNLIVPGSIIQNNPAGMNPWIVIHVIFIFLALSIFVVAFVAGVFYLFEENRIKGKKFGNIMQKLPSLNTLDKVNHLSLMIGFPLITIGIAIGFFTANQVWGPEWKWDDKETWSVVTWILYAVLLNCRLSLGWKGKKSAVGAVIGFVIIVVTLINTA